MPETSEVLHVVESNREMWSIANELLIKLGLPRNMAMFRHLPAIMNTWPVISIFEQSLTDVQRFIAESRLSVGFYLNILWSPRLFLCWNSAFLIVSYWSCCMDLIGWSMMTCAEIAYAISSVCYGSRPFAVHSQTGHVSLWLKEDDIRSAFAPHSS